MATDPVRRIFRSGLAIASVPLALLVAPLLLHRSPAPLAVGYAGSYLVLLLGVFALTGAAAWGVARRCRLRGNLRPAFAFLTALAALCATLALGEWVLRRTSLNDSFADLARWGHERSALLGFEARADHAWEAAGSRYSTDPHRFRTRRAGEVQWHGAQEWIAVVGGSSAFGYGLQDDETWPHLLEQELSSRRPGVAVVNAANLGHNSFQTYLRSYLRVLPLGPRLVLFYESRNDIEARLLPPSGPFVAEVAAPWTTTAYLAQRFPGYNPYLRSLVVYLAHSAARAHLGGADWYPLADESPEQLGPRELIRRNGESFERNVLALADACRREGAMLVAATFLFDSDLPPSFLSNALRYHNRLLRQLAARSEIELIDLAAAFAGVSDKRQYFFADGYHPSPAGAEWIAAAAAPKLEALLRRAGAAQRE